MMCLCVCARLVGSVFVCPCVSLCSVSACFLHCLMDPSPELKQLCEL